MTIPSDDPRAQLRRSAYALLIALSVGAMLGRIMAVDAVDRRAVQEFRVRQGLEGKRAALVKKGLPEDKIADALQAEEARLRDKIRLQRPFLSANDRSRWCTIRALVEEDMRVEGAPYAIDKVIAQPGWDTIDMVKHDGHLYSSKPPLLPTLLAGEYWLIHHATGATLGTHPYEIGRFMLVTINVIPLAIAMFLVAGFCERLGATDWGRMLVVATAAFGTFLTTFAVTLNNHIIAAASATVALYAVARIRLDGDRRWRWFVLAGFFAAFTAANELPALALLAALGLVLLVAAPWRALLGFAPAVVVVAASFFATNYVAHGCFRPPYMHRSEGDNWYDYAYERDGRKIESYWLHPVGLDQGETSTPRYVLHATIGHHGIFSLTPIWLLSVVGLGIALCRRGDWPRWEFAAMIAGVSVVCLIFYLFIETEGRNYGGMSSGFRWVFWLAPLWLVAMLPAVDAMSRLRIWRAVALVLLALSVLSASYPTWNPWTHPWLFDYMRHFGWI